MLKKIIVVLGLALALYFYYFHWSLPNTQSITFKAPVKQTNKILIPLDSRPVCTKLPQKLAALAGVNLILPPKELLDNYRTPAKKEKVFQWFIQNIKTEPRAIVSTDMLLSGSLLQARKGNTSTEEQLKLLNDLKNLSHQKSHLQLFHIIPRLLVSDELIPDRWYKYRLLNYSQLQDMVLTFNDPYMTQQLLKVKSTIPKPILEKYILLFKQQDIFNLQLLDLTRNNTEVLIGQDDGAPFGLPHISAELTANYIANKKAIVKNAALTYGADEIASVLIAKDYLHEVNFTPKIYIKYADDSIPNLFMPYLPVSTASVLQEKIKLIGCQETTNITNADIILYISCGNDNYRPQEKQANELKELLEGPTPVALIDLSANFEENELLIPQALKYKAPLNRLIAYAGWNTLSNSAGTALAQATILAGRLKELQTEQQKIEVCAANLNFIFERLLDDYSYQKKLHANLKRELLLRGIEPTELNNKDKGYAEGLARFFLQNQALYLLHANLGQSPFYKNSTEEYYIKDFSVKAALPWNRIFEIDVDTEIIYGIKKKK